VAPGVRRADAEFCAQLRKNLLFLKKKKQKDFYSSPQLKTAWPAAPIQDLPGHKSFLLLFFKKEVLTL
jgi:hypothetical protein